MELEEFVQPEVGVAIAVTAVVASPTVRKTLRKGAAYGLAGLLLAGDSASRFLNAVSKGAQKALKQTPQEEPAAEPEVETVSG
jgi:hypothetical protein